MNLFFFFLPALLVAAEYLVTKRTGSASQDVCCA